VRRTYLSAGASALIAVLAIAGCGGGGSSSSPSTTSTTTNGESEPASSTSGYGGGESGGATTVAVVKVLNTPKLGKVIVDSEGMTLYDFHKDKGTMSACYGACATAWPPLLTDGAPKAMGGAQASLLGTTKRKDGTVQVTYDGHPLYGFVEDQKPGQTTGNDIDEFGAEWYALEPNGEEPDDS
jgi:predicted lipoprotein with Yx(FWY)xxD motif